MSKVWIEVEEDDVEQMLDAVREALDERADNVRDMWSSMNGDFASVEFDELVEEVTAARALRELRNALKSPHRIAQFPTRGVWLESGMVWALFSYPDNGEIEVEFFDSRPRTECVGGDGSNWPRDYRIFEGFINGGDSEMIERRENGEIIHQSKTWQKGSD